MGNERLSFPFGIAVEALRGVQNIMTMTLLSAAAQGWGREREKGISMLSLQLKTGDYITIGDEVVIQLNHISGDRCKLTVQAPRDMTILRGKVLERIGGERPECVFDAPARRRMDGPLPPEPASGETGHTP